MEPFIVFFDDHCVLCSRSVRFIHRHDRKDRFRFASIGSAEYVRMVDKNPRLAHMLPQKQMKDHEKSDQSAVPGSVILHEHGRVYERSTAALRIAARLRFPVCLLTVGFILPPFIRNAIYDWIARNRYRWFGKRETCFLPEGSLRHKFL